MKLAGVRHVHLLGIAGSGMASLAGLLQLSGYRVTGSDEGIYPPASTLLAELNITAHQGFLAEHLDPVPDVVVVGNAIMRGNQELETVLNADIPCLSMPEALRWIWLQDRRRVVVAGTHGKTSVTTLLAWILTRAGIDPGYLIGGTPLGLERPFAVGRAGKESPFVLEGDEYDTSFFDKGPKFLHYRPHILVLNNVEFDHADIYRDAEAYRFAFRRLCMLPPTGGRLLVGGESADAVEASSHALCPVETFGLGQSFHWGATDVEFTAEGSRFSLCEGGEARRVIVFPMPGDYAVRNALAAWAACAALGVEDARIASGLESFPGVRRRMEVRGEPGGVLVIDDFAHHPTAIREVIAATRVRFPDRRLWVAFEPRSWSCRRKTHQETFPGAFKNADRVLFAPVHGADSLPPDDRLDVAALVEELDSLDTPAVAASGTEEIEARLLRDAEDGDVILVLSNGSFDGLHDRLLAGLERRASGSGKEVRE